jgi:general nucleoside transport system ATP-binding protein
VTEALALCGIAKRFGSVQALADASIVVPRGAIVALLGENGAGKTTLMRIAFGLERPDAGTVRVFGQPGRPVSPADAMRRGLGMVHQHFALVSPLTAAENMALGERGWYSADRAAGRLRRLASESGLPVDPDAPVESLPAGAQQRLEIVKALARGARCLIMDEPTAVLTPQESAELLRFLRDFAEGGGAVVLITHKLREALGVADAVTVMRRGHTVLSLRREEASENRIAEAMLGGAVTGAGRQELLGSRTPHESDPDAAIVASAHDLVVTSSRGAAAVRGATLELRAGQIVGLTGVEGSGAHELVRALAGRIAPSGGSLQLPPRIGYVPEDRLRDALIPEWTVVENVALRDAGGAQGRIPWRTLERTTARLLQDYAVRADGPRSRVATLSGGNQQKLVLARELDGDPSLLVVEQPTRGLDIAASAAVHERLFAARDRGAALVIASADLDELIMLCDRMLVMFDGRLREVERDRQAVGRAMLGLVARESDVAPPHS